MRIEDIASNPEPEAASASSVPGPPGTAGPQRLRGHHAAIHAAVTALRAAGQLPPNLRPCQRDRLILKWLTANGYRGDLPTRWAIRRYIESEHR
jgi:hypothetical protein